MWGLRSARHARGRGSHAVPCRCQSVPPATGTCLCSGAFAPLTRTTTDWWSTRSSWLVRRRSLSLMPPWVVAWPAYPRATHTYSLAVAFSVALAHHNRPGQVQRRSGPHAAVCVPGVWHQCVPVCVCVVCTSCQACGDGPHPPRPACVHACVCMWHHRRRRRLAVQARLGRPDAVC